MGNMIISKYPITNPIRHQLAIRKDTTRLQRFFDLKRNALTCDINLRKKNKIFLLNTHISAFSLDNTKKWQMNKIHNLVMQNISKGKNVIFGGDLNTVPPGTLKTVGYPDSSHIDDFIIDETLSMDWIQTFILDFESDYDIDRYKSVRFNSDSNISEKKLSKLHEHEFGTHGIRGKYNRKVDYLFSNLKIKDYHKKDIGLIKKGWLSDHLPVIISYELN